MLHVIDSKKPFETLAVDLVQAAARNMLAVLGAHDVRQTLARAGALFNGRCRIVELAAPLQAARVLATHPELAVVIPARIAVYEAGDRARVATVRLTALADVFASPALASLAAELESTLERVMAEAAGERAIGPARAARRTSAGANGARPSRSRKAGRPQRDGTVSPQARRRRRSARSAVRKDTMMSQPGRGPRARWSGARPEWKKS